MHYCQLPYFSALFTELIRFYASDSIKLVDSFFQVWKWKLFGCFVPTLQIVESKVVKDWKHFSETSFLIPWFRHCRLRHLAKSTHLHEAIREQKR